MNNLSANHKRILIILSVFILLIIGLIYFNTKRKSILREDSSKRGVEIATISLTPFQVQSNNSLFLVVNPSQVKVNDPVQVAVSLHASGKMLSGSDVILKYDPAYLSASDNLTLGEYFSSYPLKLIDNDKGTVRLTAFGGKKETISSPIVIFTVTFKALKPGKTELVIDYQKGSTNKSTLVERGTSKNILEGVTNAVVEIR